MSGNHEIFFSYAWEDENHQGNGREKIVNELYHSLLNDNFSVIRDKYNLRYKGLISEFIARMGEGRFIIVAISDKYLKSRFCMFELYEIARNSNLDKKKFTEKVLPVMVESVDFSNPATIEYYLSFWKNEYKIWDDLVRSHSGNLSVEQLQRYHNVKLIFQNFGMLVEWIIDMNTLNLKALSADNFSKIKDEIRRRNPRLDLKDTESDEGGWTPTPTFWLRASALITVILLVGFFVSDLWKSPAMRDANAIKDSQVDSVYYNKDTIHNSPTEIVTKDPETLVGNTTPAIESDPGDTKDSGGSIPEPRPPMCKVICDTKGVRGIEVSFYDEKNDNKKYSKISEGSDLEFDVPCYLTEGYKKVTFRKGNSRPETINVRLKAFEMPALFINDQ